MNDKPSVRIRFDKRFQLDSVEYPIKLRIYYKGKKYTVSPSKFIYAAEDVWNQAQERSGKIKPKAKELQELVDAELTKAKDALNSLRVFTIQAFTKAYKSGVVKSSNAKSTSLKDLYEKKWSEVSVLPTINSYKNSL